MQRSGADGVVSSFMATGAAALISLCLALLSGSVPGAPGLVARFAVIGGIAPGAAGAMLFLAIGRIGSARSGVFVAMTPMLSVTLAVLVLDEHWEVATVVGTVLTVVGALLLTSEQSGGAFGFAGAVLAVLTAAAFAVRDVTARALIADVDLPNLWMSTATLAGGASALALFCLVSHRPVFDCRFRQTGLAMLPTGVFLAIAMFTMFAAFHRGDVSLVAPLRNGTQAVVGVVVSAVVFGRRERTPPVLAALALIAIGGTVILLQE